MRVFFGGPEQPRVLRNLLEARVDAVPAGGEITWVTYYFRDLALADALVRAQRRGVSVRLTLEGQPRLRKANDAVIARLQSPRDGIGAGLRVAYTPLFGHLHEKLYCFSHPRPAVLVGSFNPSGNEPEDPRVLRQIGDQDRGLNLLIELAGPEVAALTAHARWMHAGPPGLLARFGAELNRPIEAGDLSAYFFPRKDNPLHALLQGLRAGSRLRIAVSHLRDGSVARRLIALSAADVLVDVITGARDRRVPRSIERALANGGVRLRRVAPLAPMHDKFLIADGPWGRWSASGSYNMTRTSRWLNHEVLIVSSDASLFDALAARWEAMSAGLSANEPRWP